MYRWVRFSCVVWSLSCCAVLVPSWNRASAQDIEVIYSEDFESTPAFQLPPGWTEENWTDPLEGSFVAGETTNLADSAELMGWTVLTEEHLRQLGGNRVNVPSVFSGNSVYAESDQRSGLQFQYLYTPVYDLRDYQDKTIVIAFDSNYMQNQDNINFAEYTLQGNLEDNEAKTWYPIFYWVDAPEIPAAKEAAAADPTYNAVDYLLDTNFVNDDNINSYAGMIRADRSLIDIDRHVEGLINDNEVTSKRRVFYALPLAAGQQYVQICFAQCGGASWFWGIDNFVLGTMASQPPDAPVLEPLADVPAGESVSLVASAFSDPDAGDTHKASTWQIAIDETFDTIVFESADDTVNLTSITVPPDALVPGNVHYARVKYSDQNDVYGAFSDPVLFFFGERELPPGALFFEDFNGRTDEGLAASGWVVQDTPEAVEDTTFWTMSQNTTRTPGPPGPDGQPTTGQFLISDSDRGNKSNPTCGGGSHDVITPPFDASDANQVFLHFKTSAVLNNNGKAVFDIDVSVGGGDFVNVFRRVAPSRFECEPFPEVGPDGNMGAAYGPVTVDLTQVAAGKSDVRIRFRHFEPNWDWWIAIDDVLVDQNPPPRGEAVLLAKEGFDNGIPGTWKVGGTDNVWAAGDEADPLGKDIVWNAGGDGTHLDGRGINRLAGQPYAMFQPGQDPATSTLDTPALDCSEMAEVFLHVDSEYLPESSFGPNEIQVSVDGGNTFSTIFAYGLGLLDNGEDAFFNHYDFPVPQAAGKPEVAFRFLAGGSDTDAFWVIDNVEVTGTPKPPLPPGVFFVENFDDQDDESLVGAGWTISDTPQATEVGTTWTSEVHRDDTNPPGPDGLPTTGNYIISDSDAGSGENPPGSGASHDIVTPSFSTAGSSDVWLHFNASVILNNNGEAIFDVDVSTDGGATFVNQYRCIAPSRSVDPRPQPGLSETQQTGGLYGPVHIRLPAAIDQPDVRIRFRHFEPNDDWWVAIDDIVVDEFPPPRGEHTILSEGFENGIPSTWTVSSNTSEGWRTTPLDTRNVDSILSGNGPSDLGGRTLNNLAGQGYVIHQMGELAETVATLDTPSLNCSGLTDVFLHLYSEYLADGGDTQSIQVSVDGGATFTDIFQYQKALQNTEEDAWFNRFTFAVPQAAGKSDVIFRFYSAGADPGETEGFWAIDNVEVTGNGVVIQPTPVPTPTPVPVLLSVGFDEATVEAAGFAYNPPTGFSAASISVGDVPPGAGTDGRGLIVQAGQGQGMLLITNNPVPVGPGPVLVTVWVRGTNLGMSAALAALNGGLDGQLGYTMADNTDLPVDSWGRLVLAYDPPNDSVHLGLQVAAREAGTVYFDNASVQELPDLESEPVTLDVAGSFDAGTEGILQNVNGDTGTVDYASRPGEVVLSITDTDDAANIGILASSLQGSFPHLLLASVDARLLSGSGGTTALVMTNGNGNVGVFFYNSGLPGIDQPPATITVAGSFETENPALPILCVVQNGGPGVTSQLAVDNLEVRRLTGGGL